MVANKQENEQFTLIESAIVIVATEIDLDQIDAVKTHCFVGVQFFADAQGEVSATPGAGTVTITVQTVNGLPVSEAIPNNVMNAAAPVTLDFAANTVRVNAVPSGVTVATHYRIVVTCNET